MGRMARGVLERIGNFPSLASLRHMSDSSPEIFPVDHDRLVCFFPFCFSASCAVQARIIKTGKLAAIKMINMEDGL
jgi:hypothetical protein